jgi:hypothetical protein
MKKLNVLNACALVDAGVVGCVGTEECLDEIDSIGAEALERTLLQILGLGSEVRLLCQFGLPALRRTFGLLPG